MTSISSYFNPCSNEFNALKDFESLTTCQKASIIILTIVTTILSAGFFTTPVFRLLVSGKVKKLDPNTLPPTPKKTETVAQTTLKIQKDTPNETPAKVEKPIDPKILELREKFAKEKKLKESEMFDLSLGYIEKKKVPVLNHSKLLYLTLLGNQLEKTGKKHGKSVDNGDCFFHAFAQGLNLIRKQRNELPLTSSDLREALESYVNDEKNSAAVNMIFNNYNSTKICANLDEYKSKIGKSWSETFIPIWGQSKVDGYFLCKIYNVNLSMWTTSIYFLEVKSNKGKEKATKRASDFYGKDQKVNRERFLANPDNWACGIDPSDSTEIDKPLPTVEIAGAYQHYYTVFKKDALLKSN